MQDEYEDVKNVLSKDMVSKGSKIVDQGRRDTGGSKRDKLVEAGARKRRNLVVPLR